jgi:hypothetical protein
MTYTNGRERTQASGFYLSDSLRPDLQSNENKKKLGFFKDELNSQILTEWLSLNPKCYAFKYQALKEDNNILKKKKAKGVSHVIVKKTLPFKVYENTLDTDETVRREITSIRSFSQELFSTSTVKDCLTSYYDKFRMLNNIECEPFGFNNNEYPP